jgi:hypothetical protein
LLTAQKDSPVLFFGMSLESESFYKKNLFLIIEKVVYSVFVTVAIINR